jgi:hydroxypyruvate isomerase
MAISRKNALIKIGALTGIPFISGLNTKLSSSDFFQTDVKQSVSRWPYQDIPLDEFCRAVKEIGFQSVELVGPEDWSSLHKHDLHCAMANGAELGLTEGFNDPSLHEQLVQNYEQMIPKVAEAGFDNLICFSGNRNGMDDQLGLENCAEGLKQLMPVAEKHDVALCMELLNSKIDHPDYMCDHTEWGVALCDEIGSNNFKLLYDIYHMQIMEGDVIRTIRENIDYIAHFHTGGVPGRNEIDDTQELNYKAIVKAIVDTGYQGLIGQEFIPTWDNKLESLEQGYEICSV